MMNLTNEKNTNSSFWQTTFQDIEHQVLSILLQRRKRKEDQLLHKSVDSFLLLLFIIWFKVKIYKIYYINNQQLLRTWSPKSNFSISQLYSFSWKQTRSTLMLLHRSAATTWITRREHTRWSNDRSCKQHVHECSLFMEISPAVTTLHGPRSSLRAWHTVRRSGQCWCYWILPLYLIISLGPERKTKFLPLPRRRKEPRIFFKIQCGPNK